MNDDCGFSKMKSLSTSIEFQLSFCFIKKRKDWALSFAVKQKITLYPRTSAIFPNETPSKNIGISNVSRNDNSYLLWLEI